MEELRVEFYIFCNADFEIETLELLKASFHLAIQYEHSFIQLFNSNKT